METTYHLLFYALLFLILAQTTAIAFCFYKFSNPINTHLLAELNESSGLYQKKITQANNNDMDFFRKRVVRQKRGNKYLQVAEKIDTIVKAEMLHLDSLIQAPFNNKSLNIVDESLSNFYNNIYGILKQNDGRYKEDISIFDNWIEQVKDSLSIDKLQIDEAMFKYFIQQKQVDVLALGQYIIYHFFDKTRISGHSYPRYRVAIIPETLALELGKTFRAKIYMTKSISMTRPSIVANGKQFSLDKDARATYKTLAKTVGKHKIEGLIKFQNYEKQQQDSIPFQIDYEVIKKCN